MPFVTNAGGSFTTAIVVTVLAWGARRLRGDWGKASLLSLATKQEKRPVGKFHSTIDPSTLRMLVGRFGGDGVECFSISASTQLAVVLGLLFPFCICMHVLVLAWNSRCSTKRQRHRAVHVRLCCVLQLETGAFPHLVIDVRVSATEEGLPAEVCDALHIPGVVGRGCFDGVLR